MAAIASVSFAFVDSGSNNKTGYTLPLGTNTGVAVEFVANYIPPFNIVDGTTVATKATVKAASVAPVATDTALVVALSPNSVNANGQALMLNSAPVVIASNQTPLAMEGDLAVASAEGAGNWPVKIGGAGRTVNPAAVADNQRVAGLFDKQGKFIAVGAIRSLKNYKETAVSGTTETPITGAVSGTYTDMYALMITNPIGGTDTVVTIKDGSGGTVFGTYVAKAGYPFTGFTVPVDSAAPAAAVNTVWTATSSVATPLTITALTVGNL